MPAHRAHSHTCTWVQPVGGSGSMADGSDAGGGTGTVTNPEIVHFLKTYPKIIAYGLYGVWL